MFSPFADIFSISYAHRSPLSSNDNRPPSNRGALSLGNSDAAEFLYSGEYYRIYVAFLLSLLLVPFKHPHISLHALNLSLSLRRLL